MKSTFIRVILLLIICLIICITISMAAPRRKGLQLVLLPHWSAASIENFLSVFRDIDGQYSKGPSEIEIAFAPYLYNPGNSYKNAQDIINAFRQSGKKVYVTVHLSFHAEKTSKDHEISLNARDFGNTFLMANRGDIMADKLIVSVCPSLEDIGSDADFKRWASSVASELSDANLRGKIYLRRSGIKSHVFPNEHLGFRGRQNEIHGEVPDERWAAYSNDGNLVYYPDREVETSLKTDCDGGNPLPRYSLTKFIDLTNKTNIGTILLWRPAYNLLVRGKDTQGNITYTKCNRDLSDSQTSFNSIEKRVLKNFLNIK